VYECMSVFVYESMSQHSNQLATTRYDFNYIQSTECTFPSIDPLIDYGLSDRRLVLQFRDGLC
jgi:hypothetical protein